MRSQWPGVLYGVGALIACACLSCKSDQVAGGAAPDGGPVGGADGGGAGGPAPDGGAPSDGGSGGGGAANGGPGTDGSGPAQVSGAVNATERLLCLAPDVPPTPAATGIAGESVPCFESGFCLENPGDMSGPWRVAGSSSGDLWALSESGLLHRSGDSWSTACSAEAGLLLQAGFAAGASDVWVGGANGLLAHWDGGAWKRTPAPTQATIWSLWAAGNGEAWAIDQDGVILRWDGSSWSQSFSAGPMFFGGYDGPDLWGDGIGHVWAHAGDRLLAFDGTAWAPVENLRAKVTSVWAARGAAAWLAGGTAVNDSTSPFVAAAFRLTAEGVATPVSLPPGYAKLVWVRGSDDRDVWIGAVKEVNGSSGDLFRWDGQGWAPVPAVDSLVPFAPLVFGPADAWARGLDLVHFDGSSWTRGLPPPGPALSAVWASPSGAVWVGGDGGVLWRLEEGQWTVVWRPSSADVAGIQALSGSSPDDVWAIGYRGGAPVALEWNGAALVERALPESVSYLWTAGPDATWVGGNGLWRWDGAKWSSVDPGFQGFISGIWGSGRDDVWVLLKSPPPLGGRGVAALAHWDGARWTHSEYPSYDLVSISGTARDDVWVAARPETCTKCQPPGPDVVNQVLHSDGSGWTNTTSLGLSALTAVLPGDVWASESTLQGMAVHHWDGTSWTRVQPPSPLGPRSMSAARGELWGVSASGLLHRQR